MQVVYVWQFRTSFSKVRDGSKGSHATLPLTVLIDTLVHKLLAIAIGDVMLCLHIQWLE